MWVYMLEQSAKTYSEMQKLHALYYQFLDNAIQITMPSQAFGRLYSVTPQHCYTNQDVHICSNVCTQWY